MVPDNVIPLAVVLLLFKTRLPVPATPPVKVKSAVLLLVNVVPDEFTFNAPLMVSAELLLLAVIAVTLEPIAALIVVVPEPAPIFVMVPTLFSVFVAKVSVPVVALLLMVKLFVPVTPPLKVVEIAVPVFPMVSVPVVPVASTMPLE